MPGMKMIVGLGNPGKKYAETRHNVGFKVIDMLGGVLGIEVNRSSFGSHMGKGEYAGNQVLLMKPMQYMNLSGQPVADAMGFYKIELKDVLVVLDDMWLGPGQIRLRASGSAGGHNGLLHVIGKLGTENVQRLRVGIGQCETGQAIGHVLGEPDKDEAELVKQGMSRAKDAAMCWLQEGIGVEMTKYNRFEE